MQFLVVFTSANDSSAASTVLKEIGESGGIGEAVQMDLTQRSSIQEAITEVGKKYGAISVLVNNAVTGGRHPVRIAESDSEEWLQMIDHNLKATYLVTKMVLPFMKGSPWGRIVHVSSEIAEDGSRCILLYDDKSRITRFQWGACRRACE
ncbi:NAD(P)-dependent dehydrogenase (short-subunit alcohol dehydrogenase family) [Paenibacillus sp. V4I9]|nr:NAD(P)-dependent dehydrogenase (short-subunit alcohol dehydrogenase family) [Paenibacillus sp. V4I9]